MKTITSVIALTLLVIQAVAVPGALALPAEPPLLPRELAQPLAGVLNTTERSACMSTAPALCDASRGNPMIGALRPCEDAEPLAQNNIVGFATWYAVHAYQERALFKPASRPFGQAWPVPEMALPIPDAAPDVCRNLWTDGRALTNTSEAPPGNTTNTTSADLVALSVTASNNVTAQENATIVGVVKNAGNQSANGGFTVRFMLDGAVYAAPSYPTGMPPGYVLNITTSAYVATNGTHDLTMIVDVFGQVNETSESNNAAASTFEAASPGPAQDPVPAPYHEDFESGLAGWQGTGLWNQTTDRSNSPSTSWYYGMQNVPAGPAGNTYNTGSANSGELRSPPIDLSGLSRARLSFWSYWQGEGGAFEHPIVRVVGGNGTYVVFDESTPQGEGRFEVNLTAFVDQTIVISFLWDTRDPVSNDFEGWYVDDVSVDEADAVSAPSGSDLVSRAIHVSPQTLEGRPVFPFVELSNNGTATATNAFTVELYLDDALLTKAWFPSGMPPGYVTSVGKAITAQGVGIHVLRAIVDVHNNETETDETNNEISQTFEVLPAAQLSVDLKDLRRVPLVTEFGDLRHPLARHAIDVVVCNAGPVTGTFVSVSLNVQGGKTNKTGAGSASIGSEFFSSLAPGACVTRVVTFDTPGVVGDFTVSATLFANNDGDWTDNTDRETGFNLVGDEGGVALIVRRA